MNTKLFKLEENLFTYVDTLHLEKGGNAVINETYIKNMFKNELIPCDKKFSLKTESYILTLAYAYNKIMSLSNSRTRILAHQVESTHRIVDALNHRFLIADEVGLGKTVEGGLVIKEFIYRYNYKRILIACPASLLFQWQNEMLSKFNESFEIMDRKILQKAQKQVGPDGNPWMVHDKIIVSLDFLKNEKFLDYLKQTPWDSVVFDEAHRLRRDSKVSTKAYTMAEIVAKKTKSLLLLSATPFRGNLEELYYLIGLLDKNILGPFNTFYQNYCLEHSDLQSLKAKINPVIIRRTKAEVGGFTKRHAKTIRFELYPDERQLYEETTKYVIEEFNRAMQTENRAVGFVMTVFQKLLDSSTFALLNALSNRYIRLKKLLQKTEQLGLFAENEYNKIEFPEDDEELPDTSVINKDKTIEELKIEIATLKNIITIANNIESNKKGEKLIELIYSLKKRGVKKFLIFTQFRTTQDYLKNLLHGFKIEIFNGSMDRDQKEDAIINFKNDSEVLIATEAGGEGRNMQFAHVLINYDLPWSPLKLEQRIGRIHRFGQKKDVLIYNFSTKDTVAERVLEVLTHKLKLFEESIGTPDIMLGQIEDELKLHTLIMEYSSGKKNKKELENEINDRISLARESFEKLRELTLANKMDFNYDEYYKITLKDRQFSNNKIEQFINSMRLETSFIDNMLGEKHPKNNLYPIKSQLDSSFNRYGTFNSESALDNENLEFLAFGHPIISTAINYCQSDDFHGNTGLTTISYFKPFNGLICNYIVTFKSKSITHEIFPVIITDAEMDEYDLGDAEKESLEQIDNTLEIPENIDDIIKNVKGKSDFFFDMARRRIQNKINKRIEKLTDSLDIHIDPELEKIKNSFENQLKELQEKLSIQEGQMKWYGKDMKGAITRTKNKIRKAENEMETLIERYKGYLGITYSVKMLNAGIIIGQ